MDDQKLAAQYDATGDLMDLCRTAAWLQETVEVETVSSQVEAGLEMSSYAGALSELKTEQLQQIRQQMRVQSMLFGGLHQWMESWDLGAGFEETYTTARRLIRTHLANLTPSQQAALQSLLIEDRQGKDLSHEMLQQVIELLSNLFSQDDWQVMAEAASKSIASRVLNAIPSLIAQTATSST